MRLLHSLSVSTYCRTKATSCLLYSTLLSRFFPVTELKKSTPKCVRLWNVKVPKPKSVLYAKALPVVFGVVAEWPSMLPAPPITAVVC